MQLHPLNTLCNNSSLPHFSPSVPTFSFPSLLLHFLCPSLILHLLLHPLQFLCVNNFYFYFFSPLTHHLPPSLTITVLKTCYALLERVLKACPKTDLNRPISGYNSLITRARMRKETVGLREIKRKE
ncbi:hypothetical protein L6164_018838 [Bauhinia variegata]|uniref:Uncharacterized protein n=1 Tax=Bauhinia variegata TaxID=167791 RepID=A0ACB9NDP5_BAUVA|nr:hypothetical protein L6164_018838 [Bauhinia variegata]